MIKFPHSFLDEIRTRILPSEVIRRKVALKNNGREFSGLCPFHKEKSPSFTVSDEKGFYHCFGCGAHGDIIKFLMETEGLPFPEVVGQLANQAGLEIPRATAEEEHRTRQANSLYDIMTLAKNWFIGQLQSPIGVVAREYLGKRMLTASAVETFSLGYAPESRHALKDFLKTKDISEPQMLELGLLSKNDRGETYDKFRGRLIFPIHDVYGHVIAFGGRIIGEGNPKYLNSPDTPLFKKGDILYNENLARKASFKTGRLVITEGYMDVISLYMSGIKEVIAPLGTAITENQLLRMWNLSKEPILCFDGDSAGQRAMLRAAALATPLLKPGCTLKFSIMPQGLDPDDVIKSGGVNKLANLLSKARSLSDVLWHHELTKIGKTTPEARALLEQNLNTLASSIKDNSVANHYRNFFREKLRGTFSNQNKYSKNSKDLPIRLTNLEKIPDITAKSRIGAESLLLLILIHNPSSLNNNDVLEELINIDFSAPKLDNLRVAILDAYNLETSSSKEILRAHLEKSGYKPDIVYLESLGLYHTDSGNDVDKTLNYWKYAVGLYNLATLEEECNNLASNMTEESELKANEIRRQIKKLEENIIQMELAFVGD